MEERNVGTKEKSLKQELKLDYFNIVWDCPERFRSEAVSIVAHE